MPVKKEHFVMIDNQQKSERISLQDPHSMDVSANKWDKIYNFELHLNAELYFAFNFFMRNFL